MSSIIVAVTATLILVIVTCGMIWDIDFRYRRCLQHLDDARLVRRDLQSIASSAISGLALVLSPTIIVADLIGSVEFSSLRTSLLLAATLLPIGIAAVLLILRLRSGHAKCPAR